MVKTKLEIEGMMCGMCEAHINDTVRKSFNVKKVTSSHKKGVTEIVSENEINKEELEKAINETGYKLISVTSSAYEKKRLFSFK